MTGLMEIAHYDDPVDQWAADREYELRMWRWTIRESNTMIGSVARLSEAFRDLRAALPHRLDFGGP